MKDAVAKAPGLRIEIVKRSEDIKGFVVLPRCWMVGALSFGSVETVAYENLADTLATFATLGAIQLAMRRLART